MPKNVYEGLFILDSNRYSRDQAGVSGQIAEIVQKHGCEILASRMWEERRLAYPIDGHRKGTYWLAYFRVDGSEIIGLERDCRISETILRSLVLKVNPRIVDALVEHAASATSLSKPKKPDVPVVPGIEIVVPEEASNELI